MPTDIRRLLREAAATPSRPLDIDAAVRHGRRARRHRFFLQAAAVALTCALAGTATWALTSRGSSGRLRVTNESRRPAENFAVTIPRGWQRAAHPLTLGPTDPHTILAAATFTIPVPTSYDPACDNQLPTVVVNAMRPDDAFVWVLERARLEGNVPGRPANFADGTVVRADACGPLLKARGQRLYWGAFQDGGREFYAAMLVGPSASATRVAEAWGILNSLRISSAAADAWHPMKPPPLIHPIAGAAIGNEAIVAFESEQEPRGMRFATYSPQAGSWTVLPAPPLDLATPFTDSPTFAWIGTEVFVWGIAGASNTSSGTMRALSYNPSAHTWRTLPAPPVTGVMQTTPVWTERELIVWGGDAGAATPVQAAAYDRATNSWRRIPSGPLHAREDPAVVWTGRDMIVWGGFRDLSKDPTEGAAFDPETNTWRVLPPSGLSERELGSAIWTGTRLLVWSGSVTNASAPGDGAMYDPTSNRWNPIGPAPIVGRYLAATVWTGDTMVIWGGTSAGQTALHDGAVYDPGADRWRTLPMSPLAGRWGAVTIWVSNRMVVLGGYRDASATPVNDGAIYSW